MEALKLGLTGNIQLQENGNKYEVVVEGDLSEIIRKLTSIERFEEIENFYLHMCDLKTGF